MNDELLPCPFCGEDTAELAYEKQDESYLVQCSWCGAMINRYDKEQTIEAWNRRASGWIPVSERLPEPHQTVLVSVEHQGDVQGDVVTGFWCECGMDDEHAWYQLNDALFENTVLAWQPFPKPYEVSND